jgi:hypothetical protein
VAARRNAYKIDVASKEEQRRNGKLKRHGRIILKPFKVILKILPVVLYGCETWLLRLREECRLKVFENRVLRRVFGPKRDEVTGNGDNYIMRSLVICTPYPILCGW